MIGPPSGVQVWLASGATDMRRGMNGLALQVQQALGQDPHSGDVYVFRGKHGDLLKVLWHDDLGMSLCAKWLERSRFIWPSPADGVIAISPVQPGYLLEGVDWRHPLRHLAGWSKILQADAYTGFNDLYAPARPPRPVKEAAYWARRPKVTRAERVEWQARGLGGESSSRLLNWGKAPLAVEAVRRIDAIFVLEREINGASAAQRLAVRLDQAVPLVNDLERWMRGERGRLSRHSEVAKAMDYMLKRCAAFRRFVDDGRMCLTSNAAKRGLHGVALGRKAWLFAGSDRGGKRVASTYSLIVTAKMNDVDPRAWLADVLARIVDHPVRRLEELLLWNWLQTQTTAERIGAA